MALNNPQELMCHKTQPTSLIDKGKFCLKVISFQLTG